MCERHANWSEDMGSRFAYLFMVIIGCLELGSVHPSAAVTQAPGKYYAREYTIKY